MSNEDMPPTSDSDSQKHIDELTLKIKEFELKEKEIALKEQEIKSKIDLDKKSVWFSSPVLIGVVSALFGLVGTGIGAALQGYSNSKLERQKFESSLIQKALEIKNRDEAAKQLIFLIDSGVIQSLDTTRIRRIAEQPNQLPTSLDKSLKKKEVLAPTSQAIYQIVSVGGLCLDAKDFGYGKQGNVLQLWQCSDQPPQPPQLWKFVNGRVLSAAGLCLDAKDFGESRPGNPLQLWECHEQPAQKWRFVNGQILSAGGLCLDAKDFGESRPGNALQLWKCNGQPTQRWSLRNTE